MLQLLTAIDSGCDAKMIRRHAQAVLRRSFDHLVNV